VLRCGATDRKGQIVSRAALLCRCALAGLLGLAAAMAAARAETKVLRVVPENDIVLLDPVFGTAGISTIAGLMIYETLFTWDSKLEPQPEMVSRWSVSPDGLLWRFTLRDGQRFHDGAPVTTTDVIASLQRWMQFDLGGARLAAAMAAMQPVDAATFEMRLTRPFPAMLPTLAAAPARFPAIMRAQDIPAARQPVTTAIGSGPFRYVAAERVSGAQIVYERNPDYVPRQEPPDGMAGGRVVKVDRVVWKIIPDAATVAAALENGEVDFVETPSLDLLPTLSRNSQITIRKLSPLSNQTMLRANNLQPPFNDVRARQALNYVVDQGDEMAAGFGDEANWRRCNSFFLCGSPNGTEAGAEGFHQDFAKARELLAAAGYHGEKLVFIASHDNANGVMSEVAADAMRRAGMNIDMVWTDWASVVGRALKQGPVSEGGWNLRITGTPGALTANPQTNAGVDMSCTRKNFSGWPCDEEAEQLRAQFADADAAARPAILEKLHRRLAEVAPYRVLGQSDSPSAWRSNVTGVLPSPWVVYWNIDKNEGDAQK
jgi:peptide/nickel transport system substrate-binding protein